MNLPQTLTITNEDLAGDYLSNTDCPLARALKRAGLPVGFREEKGFSVASYGKVSIWSGSRREQMGQYVWDDGEEFASHTLKEGRLILAGSEPDGFQHINDPRR